MCKWVGMCTHVQAPEEVRGLPRAEATCSCGQPGTGAGTELGPAARAPVLLTAEPSHWPLQVTEENIDSMRLLVSLVCSPVLAQMSMF